MAYRRAWQRDQSAVAPLTCRTRALAHMTVHTLPLVLQRRTIGTLISTSLASVVSLIVQMSLIDMSEYGKSTHSSFEDSPLPVGLRAKHTMEEVLSSLAPRELKRFSFQMDVRSSLASLGARPQALSAQELDSAFGEWLPLPRGAQPLRAQTYSY